MAEIDTLPHNLEAERAVLGACLIRQEHVDTARAVLRDGDWYRDAHRLIWRSMLRIHDAGGAVDLVTVRDDLDTRGVLEAVGGPAYVSALADGVPRSTNVQHYAGHRRAPRCRANGAHGTPERRPGRGRAGGA